MLGVFDSSLEESQQALVNTVPVVYPRAFACYDYQKQQANADPSSRNGVLRMIRLNVLMNYIK